MIKDEYEDLWVYIQYEYYFQQVRFLYYTELETEILDTDDIWYKIFNEGVDITMSDKAPFSKSYSEWERGIRDGKN